MAVTSGLGKEVLVQSNKQASKQASRQPDKQAQVGFRQATKQKWIIIYKERLTFGTVAVLDVTQLHSKRPRTASFSHLIATSVCN